MEKDGRSSAMSEGEVLDEEDDDGDDDEEGGAETEEQSGNESEMNEQEEDVSPFVMMKTSSCFSAHLSLFCWCSDMIISQLINNFVEKPLKLYLEPNE